jgi:hypothetical protein
VRSSARKDVASGKEHVADRESVRHHRYVCQAGLSQYSREVIAVVSPIVPLSRVRGAEAITTRGNTHEEPASALDVALPVHQCSSVVLDVLQHFERADHVE